MKRADNRQLITFLAIIAAGIALRIVFALTVQTQQLFDFAAYLQLARNIKNGHGHSLGGVPVAWQGPLYPYALGGVFALFRTETELAGKVLNIFLSSFTLVACVPLFTRVFKKPAHQYAAVSLMAFLPVNIMYVNVLGTEVMFTLFLVLLAHLLINRPNMVNSLLLGLLTGFSALTKPFMLIFPAALAVILWLRTGKLKQTAALAALAALMMVLVVSPFTIRNYLLLGRFIPISYNGGYVLYINNNARNANGLWMDLQEAAKGTPEEAEITERLEAAGELGVKAAHGLEPVLSKSAREWILKNPLEYLKLGFLRVYVTFFNRADDLPLWAFNQAEFSTQRDRNAAEAALGLMLNALSVMGFVFVFKRIIPFFKGLFRKEDVFLPDMVVLVIFVFLAGVVFLFEGQPRYAVPLIPLMIYAAVRLLSKSPE